MQMPWSLTLRLIDPMHVHLYGHVNMLLSLFLTVFTVRVMGIGSLALVASASSPFITC